MKKYFAPAIAVFLVLLIAVSTAGCAARINPKGAAIKYLNDKYDDTFTYYQTYGGKSFLESEKPLKIVCTSEKYPDMYVTAQYSLDRKTIQDNYISVKYSQQLDEKVSEILTSAFPQMEYYFTSFAEDTINASFCDFAPDTSFEEYLAKSGETFSVCLNYTNGEIDLEQIQNDLERQIVDAGAYFFHITIYVFEDCEDFGLNYENAISLLNHGIHAYILTARMEDNTGFTEATWNDSSEFHF